MLFVISLGIAITSELLEFGFKKIALRSIRKVSFSYSDIFVSYSRGLRYLISLVAFNLLIFGLPLLILQAGLLVTGTNILVVAGTLTGSIVMAIMLGLSGYLALLFHLYPYILLDRSGGILPTLEDAWTLTDDARFDLVIFYTVAVILNVVGLLIFGIGLLVTIPITIIAQADVYQQLSTHSFSHDDT